MTSGSTQPLSTVPPPPPPPPATYSKQSTRNAVGISPSPPPEHLSQASALRRGGRVSPTHWLRKWQRLISKG